MQEGESIKNSFGNRLRVLRKSLGLSSEEFAERLKIHPNSVYRLERGENWIGADLLERIETEFRLDISRLFSDDPPRATPEEALEILARAIRHK